jgi:hypothetical protein
MRALAESLEIRASGRLCRHGHVPLLTGGLAQLPETRRTDLPFVCDSRGGLGKMGRWKQILAPLLEM